MSILYDTQKLQETSEVLSLHGTPTLLWFLFYWGVWACVHLVVSPRIPFLPEVAGDRGRRALAENTVVSLFNSVLQSFLTIPLWTAVFFGQIGFFEDHVESFVCCFLGYNLYDLVAGLVLAKAYVFRRQPTLLIHHGIVISSLVGSLFSPFTMYYQVIATLCEVNSVFLHARSILKRCEISFRLRFDRAVLVGQYVTFLVFRLATSAWLVPEGYWYSTTIAGTPFWIILAVLLFTLNSVYLGLLLKSDLQQVKQHRN